MIWNPTTGNKLLMVSYRMGWVEIITWRRWAGLVYKSATGDLPFLVENECDSSACDHQSFLMKDHFVLTA